MKRIKILESLNEKKHNLRMSQEKNTYINILRNFV